MPAINQKGWGGTIASKQTSRAVINALATPEPISQGNPKEKGEGANPDRATIPERLKVFRAGSLPQILLSRTRRKCEFGCGTRKTRWIVKFGEYSRHRICFACMEKYPQILAQVRIFLMQATSGTVYKETID